MFDQHSFNSCSKDLDSLARERSRLDQIGVNMEGKLVCRTNAHCMASTLAHLQVVDEPKLAYTHRSLETSCHHAITNLSKNKTKVANRVFNSPLKVLKMTTSVLDAREGHKETEDVVGALEDSEDP